MHLFAQMALGNRFQDGGSFSDLAQGVGRKFAQRLIPQYSSVFSYNGVGCANSLRALLQSREKSLILI
ncbi:MAG: hypothetical protein CML46_20005 [Rhodobacteraceae bacterium]|nr:hypothetical protein [Paracoccaceae bacterium]MBR29195.1 hypothetical protein [Paracoccaceae bacterium]